MSQKEKLASIVQWYRNNGVQEAMHTLTYQMGAANILAAEHNLNDRDAEYCLLLIQTRAESIRETLDRIVRECRDE